MSPPALSIILPVRDRARLIGSSLDSARREAGDDTEIIVVDDGSADGTRGEVDQIASADPRVQLLETPQLGPAAARNAGVATARGELLTFLDSDDLYPPGRVRRQVATLGRQQASVAVVGAVLFFDRLGPDGSPSPDDRFVPFHNAVLGCATFRADAFRQFGPLDESLRFAEDVDFFLRLLEADASLVLEPEVACLYRVHADNMTRDETAKRRGYVQAYARSLARRRAAGRTRPLKSFFPGHVERERITGGTHLLQSLCPDAEPVGLRPFLDTFHVGYWCGLTGLESLGLAVDATGPGRVLVRHRREDGSTETASEVWLGEERRDLWLEPAVVSNGTFELQVDDAVTVHGGGWMSHDPPRQNVRLTIVICSFAQTEAVMANVRQLKDSCAGVIVVHQGAEGLPALDGARVIHQPNFGGTGGFARGMLEALAGDATHVLLLDDDVDVPPDLVPRLRALLERLERPTTIGGQMLDRSDPAVLSVSHEFVDLRQLRLRNPFKDTDLAPDDARRLFASRQLSTYNGWWCCCIPTDTLRAVMPLPMFVRHDDVEHGLETGRRGGGVVTMPGIFVWHEPFEAKTKPWYAYYDCRNMLIVGALHGRVPGWRMAAIFLRNTGQALLAHRYDYCWAAGQATRDFLSGPEAVFVDPRPRHEAIVAGTGRHLLRTIRSYHTRVAHREHLGRALRRPEVGPPFRAAALEMLSCARSLLLHGGRASAAYRSTRQRYASPAFWRGYLGLDG